MMVCSSCRAAASRAPTSSARAAWRPRRLEVSALQRPLHAEGHNEIGQWGDELRGEGANAVGAKEFLTERVARELIVGEVLGLATYAALELARMDPQHARVVLPPLAVIFD